MSSNLRMRHLRTFLEVARLKSITGAAQALNTVQPSVSRSLSELEAEIGQDLFLRTNRGVTLTRAGETLRRYVEGGLQQISHGVARAQGQDVQKTVVLGVLPNMARRHAPAVIARFKEQNPDICVILETRFYADVLDRLRTGVVDLVVGRMLSPDWLQGLSFERLFSEPIVFAARAGHPLCARPALAPQDLDTCQMLVPLEDTILRFEVDKFLIRHGMTTFSNRIESVSYEFVRAYLRDTDAVGCMPIGIIHEELESGELSLLDLPGDDLEGHVGITTVAGREPSEPARVMIDLFREQCGPKRLP
ncbi:MAG: LysR substrate-binding domain-containing protein [Pseudomonadota bacterium]